MSAPIKSILILKQLTLILLLFFLLSACASKKQLIYFNDSKNLDKNKIDLSYLENNIEIGDILKIDVQSLVPEASMPYNEVRSAQNITKSIEILQLEGYLVDNLGINFWRLLQQKF